MYCCLFLITKGEWSPLKFVIKSPATFSILVVVVIDVSWKFSPCSINTVKGGYSHDSLQEVHNHSLPQSHQTVPMYKINDFCK